MLLYKLVRTITKRFFIEFRVVLWKILGFVCKAITIHTEQGVFTVFCADSVIGKSLYCYREYERDLYRKVFQLLYNLKVIDSRGEGTLLDIGANIGITSISIIHDKFLKKAIAIEPDQKNFSLLLRNVRDNNLKNSVICSPYAVSDKKGKFYLELNETNFGDHRLRKNPLNVSVIEKRGDLNHRVILVEAKPLDRLINSFPKDFVEKVRLIWIDVQGHEGYVFKGGRNVFSKNIPVVAEIWPYGIKYSGMSKEEFYRIAKSFWSNYWVIHRGKFISYPISVLNTLLDELEYKEKAINIIFTK